MSSLKIKGRETFVGGGRPEKEGRLVELVGDQNWQSHWTREEGAKEMSGEERLPEERWRRVGM